VQADQGDRKNARLQLAWAAEHAKDAGLRDLARLRLAAVLLDDKEYDAALKQLTPEPAAPFAARYADLRGDILAAQGKPKDAAAAYDTALAKLDAAAKSDAAPHQDYRAIVQTKRDALGQNP
jgi:predicted negative regulator of RcsB-dependent stress response